MKEYEILIESMNPCGGEAHARKEIVEAEIESPMAYVKAKSPFPVLDQMQTQTGETLIITGDGGGYIIRYTFTEI